MKASTKVIVVLLLLAGALDAVTTLVYTQPRDWYWVEIKGIYESGPSKGSEYINNEQHYVVNTESRLGFFPFLATAIAGAAIFGINRLRKVSMSPKLGTLLISFLVCFAFSGGINNILVIGGI
jgi:hypothetical protein